MPELQPDDPKPTVLLAEDDRLIVATLSQGLRNSGFSTVEVSCKEAALRYCMESPPAIAVIDCDMPEVSGIELARALQPATFPLIFLSAGGNDRIVQAAADLGAMAYLLKPVDPLHLVATIHMALRRFSEMTALRGESVHLNSALQATRATSVVVGVLMERLSLPEKEAYDRLRAYSRSHNRKITDVAGEILVATDRLHTALSEISAARSIPAHIAGRPR